MEKVGEVTAVYGNTVEVTFCTDKDCGACHVCDGGDKRTVLRLTGTASVGDYAVVELPGATVLKASLLAYVLPIVGLLGGMAAGNLIAGSAPAAAIGGALGLILCLLAVWLTEKKRQQSPQWKPVLKQVLPRELYEKKEGKQEEPS